MISGNIEKFNSPIRQFTGKVELCGKGSIPTSISGNPVSFEGAVPGSMVDIQLTSDTITDFSNAGTKYGKNFINLTSIIGKTTTANGGTLTVEEDGGVSGSGTPTGYITAGVVSYPISNLPITTPLTLSSSGNGKNICCSIELVDASSANSVNVKAYTLVAGNQPITFTIQDIANYETITHYRIDIKRSLNNAEMSGTAYFQLEMGTVATAYEPYKEPTPIPVEVYRTGRNLCDVDATLTYTTVKYHQLAKPLSPGTYKVSYDNIVSTDTETTQTQIAFYTDYAGTRVNGLTVERGRKATHTITLTQEVKYLYFYAAQHYTASKDDTATITNFMVSVDGGDYEPYTSVVASADKDGKLSIPSLLGTNRLSSNSDVEINATYQKQLSADNATFSHDGDLVKFVVDKTGESKFFGYGVCQKIEVEVRDKDRQYNPSNNHYLQVSLDDKVVFPLFYISDTKRNENTNGLTITAYDFIAEASKHTWDELEITNLTMTNIASVIGAALGACNVLAEYDEFLGIYEEINVEGTETWREILDDIAEATQTIYFVNNNNELIFKRLSAGEPVYTIDKSQYFTLKSEPSKTLTAIVSATELGDNVIVGTTDGETQYVRDNAFWTFSQDIEHDMEAALANVSGLTITPFNCSWRGNYLLEIGDKIGLVGKDNEIIETYLLTDKLTYMGGLKQNTQWAYKSDNGTAANPSTLGEVLKQTYAKVDKANKQIEMVVSETNTNSKDISDLRIETDGIRASVGSMETITSTLNDDVSTLTNKVELAMTDEQVDIKIKSSLSNGVDKVKTTEKNYTFDDEGLSISSSDSNISTTITEDGMTVKMNDNDVLTANNEGVKAIDLHATTFLIIGENSRFEDYGSRTACFWIGG